MNDAILHDTLATPAVLPGSEHFVEAFEDAWNSRGPVRLEKFLPSPDHPSYRDVLVELIRVELEYTRKAGEPVSLADYCRRFPEVFADAAAASSIAYEDYRLRRLAGDSVSPDDYRREFGVSIDDWEVIAAADTAEGTAERSISPDASHAAYLRELRREQPEALQQWASAMAEVPQAGAKVHGFRLLDELGKGAFGRVFLARQGDLANRLVVVKVAVNLYRESQALAQLQHGHIMPIFSVHEAGALQAVCMPFLGATTLGHILRTARQRCALPASGRELRDFLRLAPGVEAVGPAGEDWDELARRSYVEAVLVLAAGLADGLAHAHARGILHCDLKPDNVLLTDDGRAMLLDFNLARDTKLRRHRAAAAVGGTMPYMAPEQLESFSKRLDQIDGRCDVYALGVILFEMLTGHPPFPRRSGRPSEVVADMIADRTGAAPAPRRFNPAVSPAADAIVRRCLTGDPAGRYQSAAELREDLQRQLSDRPLKYTKEPSQRERLRKWARRHPRLTSSGSVAALAAGVLLAVGIAAGAAREQWRDVQAHRRFQAHRLAVEDARVRLDDRHLPAGELDQAIDQCRRELAEYGIAADRPRTGWDQTTAVRYLAPAEREQLHEDVGELFYLMAKAGSLQAEQAEAGPPRAQFISRALEWNQLAETYAGDRLPRALREQRADLLQLDGQFSAGHELRAQSEKTPAQTARDHYLFGYWNVKKGQYRDAVPALQAATRLDPQAFSPWMSLGNVHLELGQPELAVASFSACISLRPDSFKAWFNRGMAYSALRLWEMAERDFDEALQRRPGYAEAYIQRAFVYKQTQRWDKAEADLTAALDCGSRQTRIYFARAFVRQKQQNFDEASEDRAEGLRQEPTDALSWLARSEEREATDKAGALADVEQALKVNPLLRHALQQKAHLLEDLKRPDDALAALNRAVELYPDHVPTRAGRGVNLARRGHRAEALQDAEEALRRDTKAPNLYQVAGIYALTSKQEKSDRLRAFELLWKSLRSGFGLDLVADDTDLDPIRQEPEFIRLVADAKQLSHRNRK
ncbi:MAG: protein kinase domain-containing protein [Gemmataceae bacterium]